MFGFLDILQDVLRIVTLQPSKPYRGGERQSQWLDGAPSRHRCERRGDERFFG